MTEEECIAKTANFVKEKFKDDSSGHDWWHLYRVWQLSKKIAKEEKDVNMLIVELAALLHDIADWKFYEGSMEAGPKAARDWLESVQVEEKVILEVEEIIRTVSFKGAGVPSAMKTNEGKIVHDADKLDAIGAIGIARCFSYGGSVGSKMYDPLKAAEMHDSFEEYKKMQSSSIAHFYEKLLLLKDRMYTSSAKKMAEHRHKYMTSFLEEFHAEWEGKR